MPYFQNPFDNDFFGHLLLEDRQYVIDYKVPANYNKSSYMFAWADPPYNTVGNTTLTINYSIDGGVSFYALALTLSSGATKTADDLASDLNAITNFASLFIAKVVVDKTGIHRLMIQALQPREKFKAYISNSSAETILRFNQKAGVAELPTYFDRHTIINFRDHGPNADRLYPDSQGCLVKLSQPGDNFYITAAGLSTTAQKDWQLLRGRSGLFRFQNITTDAGNSHRITAIVEYWAGMKEGDLAKKIEYVYGGANATSQPNYTFECPYVLQSSDLGTVPSIST
jgi:hypothetical protein